MTFPISPRVVYRKNPLESVVCQLRFPTILRIDAETPAAFQERVRAQYPHLQERPAFDLGSALPPGLGLPPEVANIINAEISSGLRNMSYDFATADELWKITLHRDFLALTTTRYVRWEDFRAHLQFAVQALIEEYSPAFYTRIGLRYKDVIVRAALGLQGRPWSDVLQPHIAAELFSPDVAAAVVNAVHQVTINLEQGPGQVQIRHGLGAATNQDDVPYVIDSDFFTVQRTETSDAFDRLDYFNSQAGRLFRWCIQERLHDALGPEPVI